MALPIAPGGLSKGAKLSKGADQLKDVSKKIGSGHAYNKHKNEFPDIKSADEFAKHIENVMSNPTDVRDLPGGRKGFWHKGSGTVVIYNPKASDLGTAFRPPDGAHYFYDVLN